MIHPAAKILRKIDNQHFFRTFDDWIELMLLAHCADRSNPDCPHEKAFMEIMSGYGPRQEGRDHPADHFKAAMWTVMDMMKAENVTKTIRDHLGEIYEQEEAYNPHLGQFVAPMPLCQLMAEFTSKGEHREHETINDPACGSGRMFLAALPHFKLNQVTFYGTDKSPTRAMMATLNMLWRNANSYIVWGSSLSAEANGGWATAQTAIGGTVREMDKDQAQAILESGLRQVAQGTQRIVPAPAARQVKEAMKTRENERGQLEMEL